MSYTDLRPWDTRNIELLLDDGTWHEAELLAYRHDADGTWWGWVRWSEAIGQQRIGWYAQERLRGDQRPSMDR